jgi:hypothetical protein
MTFVSYYPWQKNTSYYPWQRRQYVSVCSCGEPIEGASCKSPSQLRLQHAKLHVDMASPERHRPLWRKHTQSRMRLHAGYELSLAPVLLSLSLQMSSSHTKTKPREKKKSVNHDSKPKVNLENSSSIYTLIEHMRMFSSYTLFTWMSLIEQDLKTNPLC